MDSFHFSKKRTNRFNYYLKTKRNNRFHNDRVLKGSFYKIKNAEVVFDASSPEFKPGFNFDASSPKFKPGFKLDWFHLKLYQICQDLIRRSNETGFWGI